MESKQKYSNKMHPKRLNQMKSKQGHISEKLEYK